MREWVLNSAIALELIRNSDVAVVDVDGVVCIGEDAIDGAAEALAAVFGLVRKIIFATNDSRRDRVGQLARLSEALPGELEPPVVTSTDALVEELRARGHSSVGLWGPPAVESRLHQAGIAIDSSEATALVTGAAPLGWQADAEPPAGCLELLQRGADWFATNPDPEVPSATGPIPDAGAIIERLHSLTGRRPEVCGKPHPPMRSLLERHLRPADRVVMIGDRLDSDIALARDAGWSSILVGVQPAELTEPPDAIIPTLAALTCGRPITGVRHD